MVTSDIADGLQLFLVGSYDDFNLQTGKTTAFPKKSEEVEFFLDYSSSNSTPLRVSYGIQRFKCTTRLAVNIQTNAMKVVFVVCVCHLIHCRWDCDSLIEINHTIQSFGLALYRFHWLRTQLAQRYPSREWKSIVMQPFLTFEVATTSYKSTSAKYLSTQARHTGTVLYMQSLNRGTNISHLGKGTSALVPWNVYIHLLIVTFL